MKQPKKLLLLDSGDGDKVFIYKIIFSESIDVFIATPSIKPWMNSVFKTDNIIECDIYNYDTLKQSIDNFRKNTGVIFDGIGTYYDFLVVQAAKLGEDFDCIQNTPISASRSSANKFLMRETCREKGVPMPNYQLVTNSNIISLRDKINLFGFPCVVKPIIGYKSYGVKKFETTVTNEDISELFDLTNTEEKEFFKNFNNDFLIETYLSGPLVSVDGFVQNKKISFAGIVEFLMGPEPHFTQEANYIPARISKDTEKSCFEYTSSVIEALEFNHCCFHAELRITSEGPRLIEIACRLPGGPLHAGYNRAFGYNLAINLIDIWLGNETKLKPQKNNYIVQKAIFHHTGGKIQSINTPKDPLKESGVWDYVEISHVGDEIITYPKIPKPLYYYAAEANNSEKLSKIESEFEKKVTFEIIT